MLAYKIILITDCVVVEREEVKRKRKIAGGAGIVMHKIRQGVDETNSATVGLE